MIKINSQEDLDTLLALPDWEEAFLRECYLLNPSYIDSQNQILMAPYSAPTICMLICTSEVICPCIELIFEEVEGIYFSCRADLNPIAKFRNDSISFSFFGDDSPDIQSKFLYYRILNTDSWGWKVRYGKQNIFDSAGYLISENL